MKLTELVPAVVDAFYKDEIGVGHALLLAKLRPSPTRASLAPLLPRGLERRKKNRNILLPIRNLQFWIEQNVMLILKDAPFNKRDAQLVPAAGSCVDCPKRTGHNKLLFSDLGKQDACSDPGCYQAKVSAHVAQAIAAKPQLVQISTAYGTQKEDSPVLPRNKYIEIAQADEQGRCQAARIQDVQVHHRGHRHRRQRHRELQKVCANPACPVHHPKPQASGARMRSGRPSRRSSAGNKPSLTQQAFVFSLLSAPPFLCV